MQNPRARHKVSGAIYEVNQIDFYSNTALINKLNASENELLQESEECSLRDLVISQSDILNAIDASSI